MWILLPWMHLLLLLSLVVLVAVVVVVVVVMVLIVIVQVAAAVVVKSWPELVITNKRTGPVNTNLGPGLLNTNLGPGLVNTNSRSGPGPGAKQRAGDRKIQMSLKHLLRFEICPREICEKFVYEHSETIEYI